MHDSVYQFPRIENIGSPVAENLPSRQLVDKQLQMRLASPDGILGGENPTEGETA